jgi:hypothetical protein
MGHEYGWVRAILRYIRYVIAMRARRWLTA